MKPESTIGWGIVGTGYARDFARSLGSLPQARVAAVASRDLARAVDFGREFSITRCYDDVAAMAGDPAVDIVYIASPPRLHAEHAMACLRAGKPVLVEKPFAINADQARHVYALAAERRLFCMEAMWSRFLPATRQIADWLADGHIGAIRQVVADFGFTVPYDPASRYFDPAQCGGCVLDVGVYSLAFAAMALGPAPLRVQASATICPTGVDEQTAMVLAYPSGGLALLSCANRTKTPHRACIVGERGRIEVESFVWAHGATLHRDGEPALVREPKLPLPALSYQASECMRCLERGAIDSAILPATEVIERMRIVDEVRRQIGVAYPAETRFAAA